MNAQRLKSDPANDREAISLPLLTGKALVLKQALIGCVALAVAVAAFANAAAMTGVPVAGFSGNGPAFYAHQPRLDWLSIQFVGDSSKVDGEALLSAGRVIVAGKPLAVDALRVIGWGYQRLGQGDRERQAMVAAERVSRRDLLNQQWAMMDNLRRRQVAPAIRNFDILLRVNVKARAMMLAQIAGIIAYPEARQALKPYLKADTQWLPQLVQVAGEQEALAYPLAQLLLENPQINTLGRTRAGYYSMVGFLAKGGYFRTLARVYPLLPTARVGSLTSADFERRPSEQAYAPVEWQFVNKADWGANPFSSAQSSGFDAFAQPFTRGVVASKLFFTGRRAGRLVWVLEQHGDGEGDEAFVKVTCPTAPASLSRSSRNLMTIEPASRLFLTVGEGCPILSISVELAGGHESGPAGLVLSGMHWLPSD